MLATHIAQYRLGPGSCGIEDHPGAHIKLIIGKYVAHFNADNAVFFF